MNKNTVGNKIKKATNENLIKLVVEHYLNKREQGNDKGLLTASELDMAVEEANKRKIARRIDTILKADSSIAFTRFDLNTANLLFKSVISHIENELEQYKTIAEIYTSRLPKNKDQQEYRDAIIKQLSPIPDLLFKNSWTLALDTQTKKIKKSIITMQKIEEWAGYPLIRGIAEKHIKESRFNIGIFLNRLEELTFYLLYSLGQDEQDFDRIAYLLAFYSLSDSDQKRFNELYPDVETDHRFLDEEETITKLLNGKDELTGEAKEKLANLISKRAYNKYAKEYQFFHYYACIPLVEVARHYLVSKGIETKDKPASKDQTGDGESLRKIEKIKQATEKYAKDNNITVEEILRAGFLSWIDKGLFKQCSPLALSNEKELFKRWLKVKTKTRETLKKLIEKGELKTTDNGKTIIRESLYNLKGHPDIQKIIERGFYNKNKEFRNYIKERVGLDKFTGFLTKLNAIIDTHSKLSDEEAGLFRINTKTVKENIETKKNSKPEKHYKEIAQVNLYSNIPLENRGLTDADHKEIDELLKVAKGDYEH